MSGSPPPKARDRYSPDGERPDPFIPIHERLPQIGSRLASVIDNGLALMPRQRLRDAPTAIRILQGETVPAPPPKVSPSPSPSTPAPPLAPPLPMPAQPPVSPAHSLLSGWPVMLPAVGVAAYGLADSGAYAAYIAGVPGLLVLANVIGWFAWRVRRKPPAPVPPPPPPHAASTSGMGTTIDPAAGRIVAIEIQLHADNAVPITRVLRPQETLTIGRTSRSNLSVANELLSGRHVSVSVSADGEFTVEDLDSLNHTYIHQRGAAEQGQSWKEIRSATGRKGRFMLGPPDAGGVRLDIRQLAIEP